MRDKGYATHGDAAKVDERGGDEQMLRVDVIRDSKARDTVVNKWNRRYNRSSANDVCIEYAYAETSLEPGPLVLLAVKDKVRAKRIGWWALWTGAVVRNPNQFCKSR